MSAFGDEIHKLLLRLKGGEELAKHEVEAAVNAAMEHLAPLIQEAKDDAAAAVQQLLTDAKAELAALVAEVRAEVAKLTAQGATEAGSTSDGPATGMISPAPAEAPAAPAE